MNISARNWIIIGNIVCVALPAVLYFLWPALLFGTVFGLILVTSGLGALGIAGWTLMYTSFPASLLLSWSSYFLRYPRLGIFFSFLPAVFICIAVLVFLLSANILA